MAPLVHALRSESGSFSTQTCVTGQHREMLDQALKVFGISPDIDLNLMTPGQDLVDITCSTLIGIRELLKKSMPDLVLVHGDTTTSAATALACFYAGVKVGHVEAGLRTHNLSAPFPEEFNRQLTAKLSHWHFAPTAESRANLLAEGVSSDKIVVTGNTVIDSLQWVLSRIDKDLNRINAVKEKLDYVLPFDWRNNRFILVTGHRRENFGDGFMQICEALRELSINFPDTHYVYPVHLNPNVQAPVHSILSGLHNVHLIAPLDYEPFLFLLKNSYFVITDSGGIQEEAPSLGKPVLVMRDVTERPEAVRAGTVKLVGSSRGAIVEKVTELLLDQNEYHRMSRAHNPYGDGNASDRIINALKRSYV